MKRSSKLLVLSIVSCAVLVVAAVMTNSSSQKQVTQSQEAPSTVPDDASSDVTDPVVEQDCFATVLVYHHIQEHFSGEGPLYRGTTISPSKLAKQLDYLDANKYTVISYDRLVSCVTEGTPLPEKSVVLTFDGRWKSQKTNALPLLKQHKMTATFFVPVEVRDTLPVMSWDDLKELSGAGMTIGSYVRLHPLLADKDQDKWFVKELQDNRHEIAIHLGTAPVFLAYPYGGGHDKLHVMAEQSGYIAARSLDSGVAHNKETLMAMKAQNAPEYIQAFIALLQK